MTHTPTVPSGTTVKKRHFRPSIHWTIKREIWSMPCAACGSTDGVHIDHIVPVAKGGTSERSNLQPLCWYCNGAKGSREVTNEQLAALRNLTPQERQKGCFIARTEVAPCPALEV